jgi:hypothetical protein
MSFVEIFIYIQLKREFKKLTTMLGRTSSLHVEEKRMVIKIKKHPLFCWLDSFYTLQ